MKNSNYQFIRNYELETWTRCSKNYQETFGMLMDQTIPAVIRAGKIDSHSRVLDIGCGPGNSTIALGKTGAKVTGIDFSQKMIDVATSTYPELDFKLADTENIPENDSTFDAVIANYVVHHLADPEKVFLEIARVLKPNGRFVFVVWGPNEEQTSFGAFFNAFMAHHELSDLPHGPLYGVVEREIFLPMIEKGGLYNLKISKHNTVWNYQTLSPIMEGLWTWGNLAAFPQDKQDKIEKDMIVNCKSFVNANGYSFPHSAILGSAEKC